MKTLSVYNNSIPSNINKVGETVNNILCYLRNDFGELDNCTLFDLKVILNEMLLNAVMHGNNQDEGKFVKISAGITENSFAYFSVEDEGNGYDYKFFSSNITDLYNESDICSMMENGRGILIIKNLSDKVKVNDRGNKIVVLKRLNQA